MRSAGQKASEIIEKGSNQGGGAGGGGSEQSNGARTTPPVPNSSIKRCCLHRQVLAEVAGVPSHCIKTPITTDASTASGTASKIHTNRHRKGKRCSWSARQLLQTWSFHQIYKCRRQWKVHRQSWSRRTIISRSSIRPNNQYEVQQLMNSSTGEMVPQYIVDDTGRVAMFDGSAYVVAQTFDAQSGTNMDTYRIQNGNLEVWDPAQGYVPLQANAPTTVIPPTYRNRDSVSQKQLEHGNRRCILPNHALSDISKIARCRFDEHSNDDRRNYPSQTINKCHSIFNCRKKRRPTWRQIQ